jgi:hypothetical protein
MLPWIIYLPLKALSRLRFRTHRPKALTHKGFSGYSSSRIADAFFCKPLKPLPDKGFSLSKKKYFVPKLILPQAKTV